MGLIKVLVYIVVFLVVMFGAFLLYFTLTDYQPAKTEVLAEKQSPDRIGQDTLSMLIWNIGYAGLGDDMSFFYDGGSRVRTSRERVDQNLRSISEHLQQYRGVDFFLFQEVDVASKRSYHTDQFRSLHRSLGNYHGYFALNYRVQFIPIPLSSPMGKVTSGLATFSSYLPSRVVRYDFPGAYGWPKRLFMLDRCFMVSRYPLKNGKELILINTHNSAYDAGTLKKKEMERLRNFLLEAYEQGHYLIAGGDWNQFPPDIASRADRHPSLDLNRTSTVSKDFMPEGWQWVYDATTPTNRALDKPYDKSSNPTAVIDYYLVSPNIEALEIKTHSLDFRHADHQPVFARFLLK
jgi:exonuclease III